MVKFKDFEVTVRVAGQDLPEYETENDEPSKTNTITRYIEAQSGAKFEFHFKYVGGKKLPGPASIKGVAYFAYVDGSHVTGTARETPPFEGVIDHCTHSKGNKHFARDLLFSELNVVEETGGLNDASQFQALRKQLRSVGTLTVKIQRCTAVRSSLPTARPLQASMNGQSNTVPEKALKGDAKSHFVQFGREREHARHAVQCTYYDPYPFLEFKFKYRSRRALEQLHVIPRAPTPPDTDLVGLSRDELMRLVQTQRQQMQTHATPDRKIKPESSENGYSGLKRARDEEGDDVVETGTRAVRRRGSERNDWANVEIVDLSED